MLGDVLRDLSFEFFSCNENLFRTIWTVTFLAGFLVSSWSSVAAVSFDSFSMFRTCTLIKVDNFFFTTTFVSINRTLRVVPSLARLRFKPLGSLFSLSFSIISAFGKCFFGMLGKLAQIFVMCKIIVFIYNWKL